MEGGIISAAPDVEATGLTGISPAFHPGCLVGSIRRVGGAPGDGALGLERIAGRTSTLRAIHLLDHSLPQYSGYSFRSRYILRSLQRAGVDLRVVTSARHGAPDCLDEVFDDIPHARTPRPEGFLDRLQLKIPFWRERVMTRAMADRLEAVAREFAPQLIHAHSPLFNGQAALRVGRKLGIPVVYEIRAFWEDDAVDKKKIAEDGFVYRQVRRLETEVVRGADRVVCICEGLRQDLMGRGIPEEKITVVKNGVEVETFDPRPADPELAASLGLTGRRVIGFIGSFFFYEGLPFLVEAVAELRRQRDDFALLLIGSGEDLEPVRAAIARAGLDDVVKCPGRVPHEKIQDYYALIDVFCYPRHSKRLTETVTPLKPLEAMAMERSCIGSDVGGIRELFEECGVGRTFRAGDRADLVRLLGETLDRSAAELEAEGRAGREAVIRKRRWDFTLAPILQVYSRIPGVDAGEITQMPVEDPGLLRR